MRRLPLFLVFLVAVGGFAWLILDRLAEASPSRRGDGAQAAVPVEVAPVSRGPMTLRRTFSGTLEAAAQFVVAPKVGGRVETVAVDLGDVVKRGQVVATIEDDEFDQAVQSADAALAVANASLAEASSALEIAVRGLQRVQSMREKGVVSDTLLDTAIAKELASRSKVEVGKSNVVRAKADLASAKIRLGYTRVAADWSGGEDTRVVASRFVDDGGVVSPNTQLLSIVELDPILAVVEVPERDYARLKSGQSATLTTDTHVGRTFGGRITRIAPVFRRATRQARVELRFENRDKALKPGMFVRCTLELARVEAAVTVPYAALIERGGELGVFTVAANSTLAKWHPVVAGIRDADRIQIVSGLEDVAADTGVVTLGQALCDDGAQIVIAGKHEPNPARAGAKGPG